MINDYQFKLLLRGETSQARKTKIIQWRTDTCASGHWRFEHFLVHRFLFIFLIQQGNMELISKNSSHSQTITEYFPGKFPKFFGKSAKYFPFKIESGKK